MKEFKYKINGSPYRVLIRKTDPSFVELEVNGTLYVVELENKESKKLGGIKRPAPAPTPQSETTPLVTRPSDSGRGGSIQSPLPGVILEIKCNVGDTVKKGQTLMVLEAMKMENNILANKNGKIAKILVSTGASVLEGADLVIIE